MRTYPGVRPSQFRDPGERAQIKVIDDMLRQVTGALTNSVFSGQTPVANTTPPPAPGNPVLVAHDHTTPLVGGQLHEAALSLSDLTTNNVTIGRHGFAPKAPNDAAQFLDGTGGWSVPSAIDPNNPVFPIFEDGTDAYTGPDAGMAEFRFVGSYSIQIGMNTAPAGDIRINFPPESGVLMTQTNTTAVSNKIMSSATKLRVNAAGASCVFQDVTGTTKQMALDISAITAGTTRVYAGQNLSGTIPLVGNDPPAVAAGALGKVDLTAQAAAIGATNLTSTPPAGVYDVEVILMCTTLDATAGPLTVTIGWTDTVGATTSTPIAAFPLTATGRADGRQLLRVASGDITYAVGVTGAINNARYAVYVRVVALG